MSTSLKEAEKQVEVAIRRLFHWAAYADKYGGNVQVSFLIGVLSCLRVLVLSNVLKMPNKF